MTCRVEENAERGAGLVIVLDGAEPDHGGFGAIEVVDDHIEVHLLGPVL